MYQVNNVWIPIYNSYMGNIIEALQRGDEQKKLLFMKTSSEMDARLDCMDWQVICLQVISMQIHIRN